jgi:hypothetical protein
MWPQGRHVATFVAPLSPNHAVTFDETMAAGPLPGNAALQASCCS